MQLELSWCAISAIGIVLALVFGFTGAPIFLWTLGAAVVLF